MYISIQYTYIYTHTHTHTHLSRIYFLLPKHNMAVTVQVKFELSALRKCFVTHMTLIVGPVLCDLPYQELGSQ